MKVDDIESKVKEGLLNRGFSNNRILNNGGLVGATIDETISLIAPKIWIFNQKQLDINKLVEFINRQISEDNFINESDKLEAIKLIQKHK